MSRWRGQLASWWGLGLGAIAGFGTATLAETGWQLREIAGTEFACRVQGANDFPRGKCKLTVQQNGLTVWLESGRQTLQIPAETIFAITAVSWADGKTDGYIGYLTDSEQPAGNRIRYLDFEKRTTDFKPPDLVALNQLKQSRFERFQPEQWAQLTTRIQASPLGQGAIGPANNLQILSETRACVRCDLRSANLARLDLRRANLEGANLQGANLQGANLEDANLTGAMLDDADLSQANLKVVSFALASMRRANLSGAALNGARFHLAELGQANLDQVSSRSPSRGLPTDFTGANLQQASFVNSVLGGVHLVMANLTQANFQNAKFADSREVGYAVRSSLNASNLQGANFQNARLKAVTLVGTNLQDANLQQAEGADLELARLCNTTLPNGTIANQGCQN